MKAPMVSSQWSTLLGAMRLFGLVVAALRLGTVVQMLPSAKAALDTSPRPWLAAAAWVVATTMLTGLAVVVVVLRRPTGVRWAVADVAVAVLLAAAGAVTVPLADRTGSWIGFVGAYMVAVVCSLVGVRNRMVWGSLVTVLVVAEAAYLAPVLGSPHGVATFSGHLLTLVFLAPLMWAGHRGITRIAFEADVNRALAAELAREGEARRARSAIHDGTALIRMFVDKEAPDQETADLWRSQLGREVNRMRAYLAGEDEIRTPQEPDLAETLSSVAAEFSHLPLTVVADLARDVQIPPTLGHDLAASLNSLLINVQQHACASQVVLHAAESESGDGWTVVLHDDGIGFDMDTTNFGVGLGRLVIDQLAQHQVRTQVESVPGEGTTVRLDFVGASAPGPVRYAQGG